MNNNNICNTENSKYTAYINEIKQNLPEAESLIIKYKFQLSKIVYYHTGGPADILITAHTQKAVSTVIKTAKKYSLPLYPLGTGSNMIICDKGFRGIILRLGREFQKIKFSPDNNILTLGAGCIKKRALAKCASKNLDGLIYLAGVPGQIGGGLAMNAGTKYGTMSDTLCSITYADAEGKIVTLTKDSIKSHYRSSLFPKGAVALEARFHLSPVKDNTHASDLIDSIIKERKEKQPLEYPSCGSTFKNPPNKSAGRLVEASGLKGTKAGNAMISDKHANFILNIGGATSDDIISLIKMAQKTVKEKFGVALEREVIILGENGVVQD